MGWKRSVVLLGVAVLALACSKNLSKEKARTLMQEKVYSADDNVYCKWADVSLEDDGMAGGKRVWAIPEPVVGNGACVDELAAAGIIKKGRCRKTNNGTCVSLYFETGKDADVNSEHLRFPCGKKKLLEVTSITTDGKKATAKYSRSITRDAALAKKLADCALDGPKDSVEEQSREFRQDDDGNWSVEGPTKG